MNRDEIIRMAREAGFNVDEKGAINDGIETAADFSDELKHFATLVATHEREECAQIAEKAEPYQCADLIRARFKND